MTNIRNRIMIAWARFRANLRSKPYGVPYKGVVYFNKAAIKALRDEE